MMLDELVLPLLDAEPADGGVEPADGGVEPADGGVGGGPAPSGVEPIRPFEAPGQELSPEAAAAAQVFALEWLHAAGPRGARRAGAQYTGGALRRALLTATRRALRRVGAARESPSARYGGPGAPLTPDGTALERAWLHWAERDAVACFEAAAKEAAPAAARRRLRGAGRSSWLRCLWQRTAELSRGMPVPLLLCADMGQRHDALLAVYGSQDALAALGAGFTPYSQDALQAWHALDVERQAIMPKWLAPDTARDVLAREAHLCAVAEAAGALGNWYDPRSAVSVQEQLLATGGGPGRLRGRHRPRGAVG
jgi:hypothetical protein